MKVLFVSSGRGGDVGNVVRNQGDALVKTGINIKYFVIKPGLSGYLLSIFKIRNLFRQGKYDIVHAHYGLSGFIAAMAGCSPLIVSLMGSDIYYSRIGRVFARFFYKFCWQATIVKSQEMRVVAGMRKSYIIPNGVDMERFVPMRQSDARKHLDLSIEKKLVLFIANPLRQEKNITLAEKAVEALGPDVELKCIYNVPNSEIPYYLNASDVLLLTSKWEGSVNVIKEAMACNCPVVATNVGDTEWLLGYVPGHFISGFDLYDLLGKLTLALEFAKQYQKTNGRVRIQQLGLDSTTVSQQIIQIYKQLGKS